MAVRLNENQSYLAALMLISALVGCSTAKLNLEVESQVPEPVTTSIPLDLGVYYSDDFLNFIYTEQSDDRKNWNIDNRSSRLSLFNGILSSMFNGLKPVDSEAVSKGDLSVDAVLEPAVLDMQLALPKETKLEFYEAWVKYDMKLYRPGGALIDQWQVTGYGKASSEKFRKTAEGLNAAIDLALRDIGAKIALGFTKTPGVANWLCEKQQCLEITNQ